MKALYCDRCGHYYHEQLDGYKHQCNLSLLDAETAGPEIVMDLCEACKKEMLVFLKKAYLPYLLQEEKPKKKIAENLILAAYTNGKTKQEIADKFEITIMEVQKALDKFK